MSMEQDKTQGGNGTISGIKPYYTDPYCTIYNADCLDVMAQMPPKSVDLVLTDPPYGTLDGKGKVTKRGNELVDYNMGEWDRELPLEWIKYGSLVVKDGCWVCVFTDNLSVKTVWDKMQEYLLRPKQTFYWIKTNPPPQPRDNFCSGVETAVCATSGAVKKWNGGGWTVNYYQCPLVTSNRTEHTTQKPLALMSKLIQVMSLENDIVIDPFMGSGTTLRAAKDLNRKAIGIEINEEYCEIAVKRLQQEVLQF